MTEYKFAKVIGGRGCFAVVCLDVEPKESGIEVTFAEGVPRSVWGEPVNNGVSMAFKYAQQLGRIHGLHIHITEIRFNEVDTNDDVVMFVTAQAIYQALGIKPDPAVKVDQSRFYFPTN